MTARLCGPGGVRTVIAENLLLKQQLIVLRRGRKRAPNPTLCPRIARIISHTFGVDVGKNVVYRVLAKRMRREFLDHVLFWNGRDLERKLADFGDGQDHLPPALFSVSLASPVYSLFRGVFSSMRGFSIESRACLGSSPLLGLATRRGSLFGGIIICPT